MVVGRASSIHAGRTGGGREREAVRSTAIQSAFAQYVRQPDLYTWRATPRFVIVIDGFPSLSHYTWDNR